MLSAVVPWFVFLGPGRPDPLFLARPRPKPYDPDVKAVVMAGGEGSRLRPLTSRRPKPLVPVVGLPGMEHILNLLREHGITDVVVTLAYLGADIRNHFGDGSDFGMSVE